MCVSLVLVLLFVARHSAFMSCAGRRALPGGVGLRRGVAGVRTGNSFSSDIMWKDDVKAVNIRVQRLLAIFGPSLSQAEMSAIVNRFPMLLSMEEEKITQAVATLQREIPFVDPVFLLRQNAPGIELLVTCVRSERYTPHTHTHTRRCVAHGVSLLKLVALSFTELLVNLCLPPCLQLLYLLSSCCTSSSAV
jgi:hypothetical protein